MSMRILCNRPTPISANQFQLLNTYATMKYGGPGLFRGQAEHVVGAGRRWRFADEQQRRALLESADQSHPSRPTFPCSHDSSAPSRCPTSLDALYGHEFPVGPYMFGQKVSFKPTENLEFGFTRDDVFGGEGHVPITFGSFWNSFTSFTDVTARGKVLAQRSRRAPRQLRLLLPAAFRAALADALHRLAGTRRRLAGQRSAALRHQSGNLPHPFPGLPKLDFRAEAVYTDPPTVDSMGGLFIYWEVVYHDVYLNDRFSDGQLDRPRGQRLSGLEHLSPQSPQQHSGERAQRQDL